jgi:hypothetical protein
MEEPETEKSKIEKSQREAARMEEEEEQKKYMGMNTPPEKLSETEESKIQKSERGEAGMEEEEEEKEKLGITVPPENLPPTGILTSSAAASRPHIEGRNPGRSTPTWVWCLWICLFQGLAISSRAKRIRLGLSIM